MPKDKRPPPIAAAPQSAAAGGGQRVIVGKFGAPHGVRGEIRLHAFTADPHAIKQFFPLTDAGGTRSFALLGLRHVRDSVFVAQISGISDRNATELLTNVDLYADRAKFPKLELDEFYAIDLIGLDVFLESGESVGTVLDMVNYGAGDILEIKPPVGDTLLIPFTRVAVPIVDLTNRKVVIAPPIEVEALPPADRQDTDGQDE